jgi:hypothetical protein
MIIQGTEGTLCLFWNDKLISSAPLSKKKNIHYYKEKANDMIVDSLRSGYSMKEIIEVLHQLCVSTYLKKTKINKLDTEGHDMFRNCLLSLIKLELLDFDDVCLIAPRKKLSRKKQQNDHASQ